jgi:hypothetical protein
MNGSPQIEWRGQIHDLPEGELSLEDKLSKKRDQVVSVLEKCDWNRKEAGRRLSLSGTELQRILDDLEISPPSGTWPSRNHWRRKERLADKTLGEKTIIEQKATVVITKRALQEMADQRSVVSITMNMQNVGNRNERTAPTGQTGFDLLSFVESLPKPRLKNLIELVYELAIEEFYQVDHWRYGSMVASFLGVNWRSVYRRKNGNGGDNL